MKIIILLIISIALFSKELIEPIPITNSYNRQKAELGKLLFFDERLSSDNSVSCATCHNIYDGGDDNMPVSFGVDNQQGSRNSPTVLNSIYNFRQFWDGRAKNLQEQATGPIHNPIEMNSDFNTIKSKLADDTNIMDKFNKCYHDGLTEQNIADAIAEFEKTLTTPNSKFDKYLRGDHNILTENEMKGFEAFKKYGCISCHNGINLGGNLYQKIGIVQEMNTTDKGRFNITNQPEDKNFFKVPTLRNIALTAPYLHNGSVNALEDTVKIMLKYQVGLNAPSEDVENIIKFLQTLTGEQPKILDK